MFQNGKDLFGRIFLNFTMKYKQKYKRQDKGGAKAPYRLQAKPVTTIVIVVVQSSSFLLSCGAF